MTPLPLLLLDVDGVLNPFAAPACPDGYRGYAFFPEDDRRPPGRLGGRRPHRGRSRLGQVPHRTDPPAPLGPGPRPHRGHGRRAPHLAGGVVSRGPGGVGGPAGLSVPSGTIPPCPSPRENSTGRPWPVNCSSNEARCPSRTASGASWRSRRSTRPPRTRPVEPARRLRPGRAGRRVRRAHGGQGDADAHHAARRARRGLPGVPRGDAADAVRLPARRPVSPPTGLTVGGRRRAAPRSCWSSRAGRAPRPSAGLGRGAVRRREAGRARGGG